MKRQHPFAVVENIPRFSGLILLPLLRGVFTMKGGVSVWLAGAWMDLLVLAGIVGLAIWRWLAVRYEQTGRGLRILSGLWIRREVVLPRGSIASVTVTEPFLLRPFRVVRVRAETDAGSAKAFRCRLTLSSRETEKLLGFLNSREPPRESFGIGAVFGMALTVSRSLGGVLFLITFLSEIGRTVGYELREHFFHLLGDTARRVALGLPPAVTALALLIGLGWSTAFIRNFLRGCRFSAVRTDVALQIDSGLWTRLHHRIRPEKVYRTELRQSVLARSFRVGTVYLHASGCSRERDREAVLLPFVRTEHLSERIAGLIPGGRFAKNTVSACRISRYLFRPVMGGVVLGASGLTAAGAFPAFSSAILAFSCLLELPFVWRAVAGVVGFHHSGLGTDGKSYTLRYLRGTTLHTVTAAKENIVSFTVRQNPWQRYDKGCDLRIDIRSDRKKQHWIRGLPEEAVRQMLYGEEYGDDERKGTEDSGVSAEPPAG